MDAKWIKGRVDQIVKDLKQEYGAGYNKLAESHKNALVSEKILMLVLSQFDEKYKPAQELARAMLIAMHTEFGPTEEN